MAGTTIAKKYAKAFLNIFFSEITQEDISKIVVAQKFLQDHRRTLFFLQLPQFRESVRISMVEDLINFFVLSRVCIPLFLLLIAHNRSFLIPDVLSFIILLYKERTGIIDFSVVSAHPLTQEQGLKIKKFLDTLSHKNSMCTYKVDKKLIAGIRAQSVGYIWEYSVRKQLADLRALDKIGTK